MTLKKALVAITVVAMLFGMVGTAFAGGFTDITDNTVAGAAARLNALSIMKGFPDGSFGATQSITRAQFAAVAVRALGLDSAATYATGFTKFSDVAADHWASGYVNIAAQQGIIAGFPDGTFHPEDPVTYAQALTIIVRMLGYAPVTEGKGTWPSNYIVRAAMIGFTNGISFAAMDPATRGNVALFVDSSLSADMMVNDGAIGTTDTYKIAPGTNLLTTYLGASETPGLLVKSPEQLGVKAIALKGGTDLTLADGVSVAGLLGQSVNVWSKGGKVILVQSTDSASNIVSGKVAAVDTTSVTIGTTKYNFAVAPAAAEIIAVGAAASEGDDVRVTLNSDGTAKSVVSFHYTTGVVTGTDVDGKIISVNTSAGAAALDLSGTGIYTLSGAATKIADVKADDVVQYIADASNVTAIITRNAKSGTVSQYFTDLSATIGGVTYKASSQAIWDTPGTNFGAYLGDNVNLLLDKDGKVASVAVAAAAAAAKNYAFTTSATRAVGSSSAVDYYFTATKADNSAAYLKLASKVTVNSALTQTVAGSVYLPATPELITYTVDANGNVDSFNELTTAGTVTLDPTNKLANGDLVTSGTIIADVTNAKFITTADLFNLTTGFLGNVTADSTGVKAALVVVTTATPIAPTAPYAFVTGIYQDINGWHVTALANGAAATYDVDTTVNAATLSTGKLYSFTFTGGKITGGTTALADINVDPAVPTFDHNVVISYDSANSILNYKTVTIASAQIAVKYGLFNSKTVIIDNTGSAPAFGTASLLTAGKTVELYQLTSAGNLIDVVVVD